MINSLVEVEVEVMEVEEGMPPAAAVVVIEEITAKVAEAALVLVIDLRRFQLRLGHAEDASWSDIWKRTV